MLTSCRNGGLLRNQALSVWYFCSCLWLESTTHVDGTSDFSWILPSVLTGMRGLGFLAAIPGSLSLPCSHEDPVFRDSILEGHWCLKLLLFLDLLPWPHLFFGSPSASACWRMSPGQDAFKPSDLSADFFESMFADVTELSNGTDGFPFRTRTFDQLGLMQFENGTGHVSCI